MEISCYCTRLRQATRRMTDVYDRALAPLGINVAQFALLRRIRRNEPVSLTRLGSLCDLDRSTVGRNVRVLERMGLAVTGRSEDDQRESVVKLSPQGHDILVLAEPLWDRAQHSIKEKLGPQKLEALEDLIATI